MIVVIFITINFDRKCTVLIVALEGQSAGMCYEIRLLEF